MSRWTIGCLILALASAVPVAAGTLYVPSAENAVIEGIEYRTQMWVSNQGGESRRFSTLLLEEDTDGTDREAGASDQTLGVPAEATVFINSLVDEGEFGMLEILAAPQLAFSARMVSFVNGAPFDSAELPVVSSDNLLDPDTRVELSPLSKRATGASDLILVNLGFEAAECNVDLFRANGNTLSGRAVLALAPLSMRRFSDVLGLVGVNALAAGRASISCDQAYYAYATTITTTTGEIVVTNPAKLGTSTLKRPGDEPPELPCPTGGECFEVPGDFFTPRRGDDKRRVEIPVSKNVEFGSFEIELDFFHGGWFRLLPSGIHNIIWVTRTGKFSGDTVCFVTTRGPNRNLVRNEVNANLPRNVSTKVTQNVLLQEQTLYRLLYSYNGRTGAISLTIHEVISGREVVNIAHRDAKRARTGAGSWSANFSDNFEEVHAPSHNWIYSNFKIRFIP